MTEKLFICSGCGDCRYVNDAEQEVLRQRKADGEKQVFITHHCGGKLEEVPPVPVLSRTPQKESGFMSLRRKGRLN